MHHGNRSGALILLVIFALACSKAEKLAKPEGAQAVPTRISDRGVQEHGKVWPRSIDSAYRG